MTTELHIRELDLDKIAPNPSTMGNPDQGGSKIVVIGKPGCFGRGTMIRMFNDKVKRIEKVKEHDVVMGYDSKPRHVGQMCRGIDHMYHIDYGIGKVIVNESHIMTCFYRNAVHDLYLYDLLQKKDRSQYMWIVKDKGFFSMQIQYMGINEYFGFEIMEEDRHFLLKDNSIVHNTGKCLGKDTPILMHNFSVKMVQDVQIGDLIRGDDDEPRRVLSVAKGIDRLFKVKQEHGIDYIVNSSHILCLRMGESIIEVPIERLLENENILKTFKGYRISNLNKNDSVHSILQEMYMTDKKKLLQLVKQPYLIDQDGEISLISTKGHDESFIWIEEFCTEGEYFGFEIDKNGRFCLGDGTVTHNTTLITDLLYQKRMIFPLALIISGTEDSNGHYKKIVPSTFVFNSYSEKKIEDFITRQKIAKKHLSNPWAVLLMDDCTDDPKIFNRPLIHGIFKNGRHWKMLFILSLQYCMDIKPVIRNNIDGTFILRETNMRNRRSLWENYAGVIPDFSIFCQLMDQLTSEYCALYIHNATTSNRLEDCVFWYKAKPVPSNFKFGCKDLWKYHHHRFNKEYIDPFI